MPEITVVLGLVELGGKILIGKKVQEEHPFGLGGKWVLPGGEVQAGETVREALERKLSEETHVVVDLIECLGVWTQYRWGTFTRILYILCEPLLEQDIPVPGGDLQELKWLDMNQALEELDPQVIDILPPQVLEYLVGERYHEYDNWKTYRSAQNFV